MKNVFLLVVLSALSTASAYAADLDADVFKERRQALMAALDGRVAVLYGAELRLAKRSKRPPAFRKCAVLAGLEVT